MFEQILESFFDTDFFKSLTKKYKDITFKLSSSEEDNINRMLNNPCALPDPNEGTLEAWLLRLSIWGKAKITWKSPENKTKKIITEDEFLNYMDDEKRQKAYGTWKVEELDVNVIRFRRDYWTINNKNETEEMLVEINLREDLKKILKKARGLF